MLVGLTLVGLTLLIVNSTRCAQYSNIAVPNASLNIALYMLRRAIWFVLNKLVLGISISNSFICEYKRLRD